MSKIIVVASQKGGVGKSTIITNLAAALVGMGKSVVLVDADEQTTASEWGASRSDHPDAIKIDVMQERGEIDKLLESLNYDYVLVDTAGHASIEMRSSMSVADIVLCPFRPSQADLNTLGYLSGVVDMAVTINTKMRTLAIINTAPTNPKMPGVAQAQALIAEYPELALANTVIYHRDVFLSSMSEGLGVTEMTGKSASEIKARDETNALALEVING